jgi:hypothetical protein
MSTTPRSTATDRFFDALIERQSGAFDALRSNNERYQRFNRSLLEGARQGSRDWTEVGRRWVANPTDVVALYESIAETVANSQARMLALSREWLEDVVESQRETREVMRQGLGDVREAVERVSANAPQFLRRANLTRRSNGSPAPTASEK